jgi:pimeloyl-ACP methyl ester carboxylesterase
VAWQGRPPDELYAKGEVRAFSITQGGQRIGTSWGRYVGADPKDPSHHRFETRIEIEVPGRPPARSEGVLVLDERGHLVHGYERSNAAELRFTRKGDVIELDNGERTDEIGYAPQRVDTAVMAHSAILHEEMMFALRRVVEGEASWRLVSLSGSPPQEWSGQVRIVETDGTPKARVDTVLGETITLADGRIESVVAEGSDLEVRAIEQAWPAWTIEGPRKLAYAVPDDAAFTLREVELAGRPGEPALWGEVTVPTEGKKPFAGVLWIGGTGQEDRHGFAGPPPVDLGGHEITDALADAGFVVMRFDERGRGKSERGEDPLSFEAQIEDARRAYRTLLVQPEVDPDRVVIVGHGDGGWRALSVAAGRGDGVRGVALLGTPGRPYREVYLHASEAWLEQVPPALRKDARAQQEAMIEALAHGDEVPPELRDQAQWIREVMAIRPDRLVAQAPGQLWLAQGGKDFEVDPQADLRALVAAAKKHKRRHQVQRYPQLDHLFKPESGASDPSRYLDPDRHVDPGFVADLVKWSRHVTSGDRR